MASSSSSFPNSATALPYSSLLPSYFSKKSREEFSFFEVEEIFLSAYEGTHYEVTALLGFAHFFGVDREINHARARQICTFLNKNSADWNDDEIESWYLEEYRINSTSMQNFDAFFEVCRRGVSHERYKLYYVVAISYLYGYGVEANFEEARKNIDILLADFKTYARVHYLMGLIYKDGLVCGSKRVEINCNLAKDAFKQACKLDFMPAFSEMAVLYGRGDGFTSPKPILAYANNMNAKSKMEALALYHFGFYYEHGFLYRHITITINKEAALECYRTSAKKGCVLAIYKMATLYRNGVKDGAYTVLAPNTYKALKYVRLAARKLYPDALYSLGNCYKKGILTTANAITALDFFRKAAHLGHTKAYYQLAALSLKRVGRVSGNSSSALHNLIVAADRDLPAAQYRLALYLMNAEDGLPVDGARVVGLLGSACEKGHAGACITLAKLYEKGEFLLPQSYEEALHYFIKASEDKSAAAMHLCYYYLFGFGTEVNLDLALNYCLKALMKKEKDYDETLNERVEMILDILKEERFRSNNDVNFLLYLFCQHQHIESSDKVFHEIIKHQLPQAEAGILEADMILGLIYSLLGEIPSAFLYSNKAHEHLYDAIFYTHFKLTASAYLQNVPRQRDSSGGIFLELGKVIKTYHATIKRRSFKELYYFLGQYHFNAGEFLKAVQFCNLANHENDHSPAQAILGYCYLYGKGVAGCNIYLAKKKLSLPASKGDAEASMHLAFCFEKTNEIEEAVRLLDLAAKAGIAAAQYRLAHYYFEGSKISRSPVIQDEQVAIELLQKATQQGYPDAIRELSQCYRMGRGVTEDQDEAARLLDLVTVMEVEPSANSTRVESPLQHSQPIIERRLGLPRADMLLDLSCIQQDD